MRRKIRGYVPANREERQHRKMSRTNRSIAIDLRLEGFFSTQRRYARQENPEHFHTSSAQGTTGIETGWEYEEDDRD
jgi:hypothetical protein